MAGDEPVRHPLIVGAGPAGLSASLALVGNGVMSTVFEGGRCAGGLAGTAKSGRFLADPGGHRFMTDDPEVREIWQSLLGPDEWLTVDRSSAMFVEGHYVNYPLEARNLLRELGGRRAVQGIASYGLSKLRHVLHRGGDETFEHWGIRTFGEFWYSTFFDSYTRKTWRVDPTHITSDWARQRIQPITWASPASLGGQPFSFPRYGPGQVWQSLAQRLTTSGVDLRFECTVVSIQESGTGWELELDDGSKHWGDAVFSSMPLRTLINCLQPTPPRDVIDAAKQLAYRDVVTVAVPVGPESNFPYQWVYIPQNDVQVGRIQNYGQWSRWLMPSQWNGTCLGLEYYVQEAERDTYDDDHFLRVARDDLQKLGIKPIDSDPAFVVRSRFAYPIYDDRRADAVAVIRKWLTAEQSGLFTIGRNGMHQYYNQDHAMISAMASVRKYLGSDIDPWASNDIKRP